MFAIADAFHDHPNPNVCFVGDELIGKAVDLARHLEARDAASFVDRKQAMLDAAEARAEARHEATAAGR